VIAEFIYIRYKDSKLMTIARDESRKVQRRIDDDNDIRSSDK